MSAHAHAHTQSLLLTSRAQFQCRDTADVKLRLVNNMSAHCALWLRSVGYA